MGSVYLRGKSIVGKYNDENGNWVRKTLGTYPAINKTIAREILQKIERKVMLGQHDLVKVKIPTLKDFSMVYIEYQREVRQKRSWKKDESHLGRFNRLWGTASYRISQLKMSMITSP